MKVSLRKIRKSNCWSRVILSLVILLVSVSMYSQKALAEACPNCENGIAQCDDCSGTGKGGKCSECDGKGRFACRECNGSGRQGEGECSTCCGTGLDYESECETCGGQGYPTCESCQGSGKRTCTSCYGSGLHSLRAYDLTFTKEEGIKFKMNAGEIWLNCNRFDFELRAGKSAVDYSEVFPNKEMNTENAFHTESDIASFGGGFPTASLRIDASKVQSISGLNAENTHIWLFVRATYNGTPMSKKINGHTQDYYDDVVYLGSFKTLADFKNASSWRTCPDCKDGIADCAICGGTGYQKKCDDCTNGIKRYGCPVCDGRGYPLCPDCGGTGETDVMMDRCETCLGTGRAPYDCENCEDGTFTGSCDKCGGTGGTKCTANCNNGKVTCTRCSGSGTVPPHSHQFSYSVEENSVLKAVCSEDDCKDNETVCQLTLSADSKTFDHSEAVVTVGTEEEKLKWTEQGLILPQVAYYQNGQILSGAPVKVGAYVAKIGPNNQTLTEENTAFVEFVISVDENEVHQFVADESTSEHVCSLCGYKGAHCYAGNYISTGDGKHYRTCEVCGAGSAKEECSGGQATCTEVAVCSVCRGHYGDLASHVFSLGWSANGEKHWHECKNCKFKKDEAKHNIKTTITAATSSKNGKKVSKCDVCDKVTKTSTIYAAKTIGLDTMTYTYDGKAKKPSVTVKDSKGKTIAKDYYTLKYDDGRKLVGKYNVVLTFKGEYKGTEKMSFTINPMKTEIKSVTPASKALTVAWEKKTNQVDGYEIRYSLSSTFEQDVKTAKVTKNTTLTKKLSNLQAGKKYYVQVRTYKKVGTKTYYSEWSKSVSGKPQK